MISIIPAIDIIGGKCVRLTRGDYDTQTTYGADPVDMVKRFVDHGLTHIHAVDLNGAREGKPLELHLLEKMASVNNARIEWGGGLKRDEDVRDLFNAGATWGVIGSVAVRNPQLMEGWLVRYGERMVLGADVRDGKVAVSGWLEDSDLTIGNLVERFAPFGLGRAIVTEISCDGMLAGPAFELYRALDAKYPAIEFTASGGVSSLADIERLDADGVKSVIVGKAIYEGRIRLEELEVKG